METLFCQAGKHDWQREKKRGAKPASCPEHGAAKAQVDKEERQRRMQEGRAKAHAARQKDGVEAVTKWRENWLKPDAQLWAQYRAGFITRQEWLDRKPELLTPPDKTAWTAAAEAGIVVGSPLPAISTGEDE